MNDITMRNTIYYIYLQEFWCSIMQSLHSVAEVIGITKVKIRCVQNGLDHLQIRGIILHLSLGQMQGGPCVRYHIRRRYLVDIVPSYSPAHLGVCNDNEVTTCQKTYSPYQSPYLSAAGSCRNLTGRAN